MGRAAPRGSSFFFLKTSFKNNKIMKQMYFAEAEGSGEKQS